MKEMFPPEKCPKCRTTTVVIHYDNGRVECPNNPKCDWYGEFHFDEPAGAKKQIVMKIRIEPSIADKMIDIRSPLW